MIAIQNLTVEFSARPVFNNISYVINNRDRIALVGRNGAGKTTMMRVIAGLQRATSGSVAIPADTTVGYLPQQMEILNTATVVEEVSKAFAHIDELQRQVDDLNCQLAERTDYESGEYARIVVIDEYNRGEAPFGYNVPGANATISITFTVTGLTD